jgi:hypothetical protein
MDETMPTGARLALLAALLTVGAGVARAQVTPPDYLVLDTAKTSTMQRELQEAADRGYRLVPGQGSWLLSAIMEKPAEEPPPIDYLLLATSKSGTMQKEMNEAASKGYRFASVLGIGPEVVICMERRRAVTARTHEQKLLATTKIGTMEKELLAEVANGYRFVGQTVFVNWLGNEYVAILERRVP